MKKFSFFTLLLISILGCSQITNELAKRREPDPPSTEIPIKGISDGIEYRNNFSKHDRVLSFSDVDQTYDINPEDKVVISLDYNLAQDEDLFIMSRYNSNSNKITIGLYDRFWDKKITLKSKCDVVEIRGLYDIPEINLDPDLSPEQIIITPLFDNDCLRYGFQIRYGSTERGCGSVAIAVLKRFQRCTKPPPPNGPPPCYEKRWFGIDCP